ncbi:MAG: hypothetical protein CL573_06940 [Alphaproteobacteria bacterium]|nr:hypothetical protein [Alphaproteobacteria bacterium]HCP01840.1 DUF2948 domain-containing protein [Rhodospirillaceae bacterium]
MRTDAPLLKLAATDKTDLEVVSGVLQGAIIPVGEMAYVLVDRAFVLVANRFRWEVGNTGKNGERVNAGVTFSNVMDVKCRGIDFRDRGAFLELLAIICEPEGGNCRPTVQLTFSGDTAIRLQTTGLLCHLEDFGEPWPTNWRPEHAGK